MAHYLFNFLEGREQADVSIQAKRWDVAADEPHRDALAPGDLVLLYLGAPDRELIGRAELASAVHEGAVLLARVENWDPPVPMSSVLAHIASPIARADFETGVVEITADEYETAVAVATS